MIDRDHALSVTKQAEIVGIARSTVYYLPRPVPAADLELMKQIDRLHMEFPFAGARMLRRLLAADGSKVGRRHVRTLMSRMGIEALYRRPRTTKPEPGHKIFPYLLRGAWQNVMGRKKASHPVRSAGHSDRCGVGHRTPAESSPRQVAHFRLSAVSRASAITPKIVSGEAMRPGPRAPQLR